jgi:hypothetical protein
MDARFSLDHTGLLLLNTCYLIPTKDPYLCAVLNSAAAWEYIKQVASILGDEQTGGRIRVIRQYSEALPIPAAPAGERAAVACLAQRAQELHSRRRARVEAFLQAVGLSPAQSSSRNPLEEPWSMSPDDFARRCRGVDSRVFTAARDETAALTAEIARVEAEIDQRVAALYGVD